jgi:hypothetical protein
VHELPVPNIAEFDFRALRAGRLARLQAMMKRHDLPVALLYTMANIRYATGVDVMAVWTAGTFARYCLVPAEGAPILFEYSGSMHVSQKVIRDVRPAYTWRFGGTAARDKAREWAGSIRSALKELGLERERLAVDRLDTPGFLALQDEGLTLVDIGPAAVDAREVKTPEEIQLFAINGGIGDAMLTDFAAAIRPGIREYELLAVLSDSLMRRHGEGLFTRLVASGTNTNPWLTEAHDKAVMPGDLVGVDTDANGFEGLRDRRVPHVSLRRQSFAGAEGSVPGRLRLRDGHARPRAPGNHVRRVRRQGPAPAGGVRRPALPDDGPPGRPGGRGPWHSLPRRFAGSATHHAGARAEGEHGPLPRVLRRQAGRAVRRQAGGPGARHRERSEAHLHVPVRGGAARLIAVPP